MKEDDLSVLECHTGKMKNSMEEKGLCRTQEMEEMTKEKTLGEIGRH